MIFFVALFYFYDQGQFKQERNNNSYSYKKYSFHFGEGLKGLNGSMFQLTWKNHVAYQFDKQSMKQQTQFQYPNEGWGLCTDGDQLIASDGSANLYFIKPADFSILNWRGYSILFHS